MVLTLAAILLGSLVAAEPAAPGGGSHAAVTGSVTLTDARGEGFNAPGVHLALTCAPAPGELRNAATDESGVFRFADVAPGSCSLTAELQGFGTVTTTVVVPPAKTVPVDIHLTVAPLEAGIRVVAPGPNSSHKKSSNRSSGG
jgi:hypothetical protein